LIRSRCTTLCDKVYQRLATGQRFSPATPVSSTNKTYRQDIAEILLKLALNPIKQTRERKKQTKGDELYLVIGHLALVDFGFTGCTVLCTCSQRFKLFGFPIF
jgi:cytochrome oxidase Cu insertion factor (SCO1/SenC/PrrC family)